LHLFFVEKLIFFYSRFARDTPPNGTKKQVKKQKQAKKQEWLLTLATLPRTSSL